MYFIGSFKEILYCKRIDNFVKKNVWIKKQNFDGGIEIFAR